MNPDLTRQRLFLRDYQFCVQCAHWLHCRWVLNGVESGATLGDEDARAATGTSAPVRGFIPLCEPRDQRKDGV